MPDPRLHDMVAGSYQGYVEPGPAHIRRREVPSGLVPLILTLGQPVWLIEAPRSAGRAELHGSFVAGLHDGPALVESIGPSVGIQINLTPPGAYGLLGLPLDTLANRSVDLAAVVGSSALQFIEQLVELSSWEARFALLDRYLLNRLARAIEPSGAVVWALGRIEQTGGRLSIGALAEEIGWSRKHLAARFRAQVGLPPKTIARITRFARACERLERTGRGDWADLAYDCGYSDQAHLIREFRALAGTTPTDLLKLRAPDGGGLIER